MSRWIKIACAIAIAAGLVVVGWSAYWNHPAPAVKPQPLFEDRAAESGITFRTNFLPGEQGEKFKINLYDHGSAVAVGDYDGDGHDDIYLVNQLGGNALYRNNGTGAFEDRTQEAGVEVGDRICVSATFADYDNDGRQDLFVTSVRGGNILFHNEGNGRFRDVTKEAGLQHVGHSQSAVFFDFDKDGYLDLLVLNTAKWTESNPEPKGRYFPGKTTYFETAGSEKEHNLLYRNNGDGTFRDVTARSGLKGLGWGADAAVFDYDGDGYLDVAITNMFGRAQLYRNKGDGVFVETTRETLGPTSWGGMGVFPFDYNNDGKFDLFIVDMHSDMWMPFEADLSAVNDKRKNQSASGPFGPTDQRFGDWDRAFADLVKVRYDEVLFGNTFFKNLGGGKFTEVSEQANLETFWPWGIACGDFDNDGYEDIFIPSGMGYPFNYWGNYLMMNQGDETFVNRAKEFGIEPPRGNIYQDHDIGGKRATRSSRAAAVADFDHDGRLDIICNNFNDVPYYFKNVGKQRSFLALRLIGTRSNRDAVGAVVRLHAGEQIMTRQVHGASGYLAQSSKVLHFGLGEHAKIDKLEITWPSGRRQEIAPLPLNALHTVTEPDER